MKSKSLTGFTITALFAAATITKALALGFLLLTLVGCEGIAIPRAHAQSSLALSATYLFRSQGLVPDGQPFFESGLVYFFPDGTKCVTPPCTSSTSQLETVIRARPGLWARTRAQETCASDHLAMLIRQLCTFRATNP